MLPHVLFTVFLLSALATAQNTLGGQLGSCSYTTIWYNSQAELQASLSAVSSSYSICNSSAPTTTVPSPTVAATTTTAAATTTSSCPLQPTPPCFNIIGHGESHIEGLKLGISGGAGNPRFDPAANTIFYIDGNGHLHTADSYNGVTMTYYISSESWWGVWPANYPQTQGSAYQPSTCTAYSNGTLDCFQYGGIQNDLINVWEYTAAPDSRAFYLPHWGPAGFMVPITLTWQVVTCPSLC